MHLEFQEKMIIEEVVDFCAERGLCISNKYFSARTYLRTLWQLEAKMEWR